MQETEPIITCVFTAPRERSTLNETLYSLQNAGFRKYWIYQDSKRSGCWQAWLSALRDVLQLPPAAPWILICEDDILLAEGLYPYLLRKISTAPPAVYSLFSNSETRTDQLMAFSRVPVPVRAQGSLCYLIERSIAEAIVAAPPFPDRRDGTDHNIGTWCRNNEVPFFVHSPSLVAHLAPGNSSLEVAGGQELLRQCHCFVSEIVDASDVPELGGWAGGMVETYLPAIGILPPSWRARSNSSGGRLPHNPHSLSVYEG